MRRGRLPAIAGLLAAGTMVVAFGGAAAWSDGTAGASGARPMCPAGQDDCKPPSDGCGDCHGSREDMQAQPRTQPPHELPVVDRLRAEVVLDEDARRWEYEPGRSQAYAVDVFVHTDRAPGRYNHAGFTLNASAGTFAPRPGDATVRVTGGTWEHEGSKNASSTGAGDPPHGALSQDESAWAGELTQTRLGANVSKSADGYHWRALWYAPERGRPHGVLFSLAFLVANDDGIETRCLREACNASRPYADASTWDWWSWAEPAKTLCETGHFQGSVECDETVRSALSGGRDDRDGSGPANGRSLPVAAVVGIVGIAVAALWRRS